MIPSTPHRSPFARALAYTQRGWTVLAVRSRQPSRAADDHHASIGPGAALDAVQLFKAAIDDDANLALATGARSGVWALLVNGLHGTQALLAEEGKHGRLPPTPTLHVGRGRMLLFDFNGCEELRCTDGVRGLPLDVRAEGGWILLPPSLDDRGRRLRWQHSPETLAPAPTPLWLWELANTEPIAVAQVPACVPGERQVAVRRLGGQHREA